MKRSVLILSTLLVAFGLTAFSLINWNDATPLPKEAPPSKAITADFDPLSFIKQEVAADFFYDIGTRFRPIKKEGLDNAVSITDFLPRKMTDPVVAYKSVKVIILDDHRQTEMYETGNSPTLTAAQAQLLRSADYSTNILIRAEYEWLNVKTGLLEDNYFTPYLTIVPEVQAEYVNGKDALISYLRANSEAITANVKEGKLKAGKLYFTVTKDGSISAIELAATSGYPAIDERMIELITTIPGQWKPAENSEGEKVDQKLVFSFGIIGC